MSEGYITSSQWITPDRWPSHMHTRAHTHTHTHTVFTDVKKSLTQSLSMLQREKTVAL